MKEIDAKFSTFELDVLYESLKLEISIQTKSSIDDIDQHFVDCNVNAIEEHNQRMDRYKLLETIFPYKDVETWFDTLDQNEVDSWCDLYMRYQYGPEGDGALGFIGDELLTWEVLALISNRKLC